MRFKNTDGEFRLYAVSGTYTIAFGIDCDEDKLDGLLGFMVEKEYTKENGDHVRVTVMGFKVFKERVPNPIPGALYSTYDNPIQALTWEDYSAYAGSKYIYHFTPLYGNPMDIKRGETVSINVETEPKWLANDHSVFFNRGVASSQAYAMKFSNLPPEDAGEEAYTWLSRGLKEAIYYFIENTPDNGELYCSFYEFRFDGVLQKLYSAAERGVKVHIVYDAKENEHFEADRKDKTKKIFVESFPRAENQKAIKIAKLDQHANIRLIPRERNKSYISHNKFMIRVVNGQPMSVFTGSTNISRGGIFGQTNVGHAVDDAGVAGRYMIYWTAISSDPETTNFKRSNEEIQADLLDPLNIPDGMTCIFSPRKTTDMLEFYARLLDSAESCSCITLAFGVSQEFEDVLADNNQNSPITFLLLEKDEKDKFDYVYQNNVAKAVGSYIPDSTLYKWVKERNTGALGLNTHVKYIHSKFLLRDPLSARPVVVTGSANFSAPSTNANDENMVIIAGNLRVADIYFTEFLRIFNHYYFRWIVTKLKEKGKLDPNNPAFLQTPEKWTEQYRAGKFKRKRVEIFASMFIG